MAATPGVKMYLPEPGEQETWNIVKEHYGNAYSGSAVLYELVKEKAREIQSGQTKRAMISETHALVKAMVMAVIFIVRTIKPGSAEGDQIVEGLYAAMKEQK